MKIQNYTCDVCGKAKQDHETWYRALIDPLRTTAITIMSWDEANSDNYQHLCGEQCVREWVRKNLPK